MSRKHYIATAEIIAAQLPVSPDTEPIDVLSNVTRELALMFKRDNAAFNAGKFFEAAGFPELTGTRMGLN